MQGKTKIMLLVVLLLLSALPAAAKQGSIKLLAVSEKEDGYTGDVANLFLDIRPGTGRVFIDTLPASKLDTQMSTRFAKNIACKYAEADCDKYDFIYTIRSDSTIVGGPSAGAAVTILTISLLEDLELNQSVVITGTINSGNLVGKVGGLKLKIGSAPKLNIKKVLIPKGEALVDEGNGTINLMEFGKNLSIEVVEIGNIDEALYEFTGRNFEQNNGHIEVNPHYEKTMKNLAITLCNRSEKLQKTSDKYQADIENYGNFSINAKSKSDNLTQKGTVALDYEKYYSAASYCFGANVYYSFLLLELKDLDEVGFEAMVEKTEKKIDDIDRIVESYDIETITDLQAFMVVKDRLEEAKESLDISREEFEKNDTEDAMYELAYAIERVNSAISWSEFFGKPGRKFSIEKEDLKESCLTKLREAEEYYQYSQLFFPGLLDETMKSIRSGYEDHNNGKYQVCLFKATIAKANVNSVLSSISTRKENIRELVERKIDAAGKGIISQQKNDIFPILGYSYYEYAKSLIDEDPYSSLLYAEYSLELSNLDIYFKTKNGISLPWIDHVWVFYLFFGIVLGFSVTELVHTLIRIRNQKSKSVHGKHSKKPKKRKY